MTIIFFPTVETGHLVVRLRCFVAVFSLLLSMADLRDPLASVITRMASLGHFLQKCMFTLESIV